ncbi:hypothetical protein R84B8_02402 [Treponema sp. R8-4-B8]
MSDLETGGGNEKFDQRTNNLFFNFSKPYLDFISKGKIFSLVYIIMAVINLILPFVILYMVIDSGLFEFGAKYVFTFIVAWLVIVFACWIGFQIWWNRRTKISIISSSEFVATPIFSEILQTFGEWVGTFLGIVGAGVGLIANIALGSDAKYLFSAIGMNFMKMGALIIFIGPIVGFFIIIISRYIAEQLRIFAALANNTKEIATNIKSK